MSKNNNRHQQLPSEDTDMVDNGRTSQNIYNDKPSVENVPNKKHSKRDLRQVSEDNKVGFRIGIRSFEWFNILLFVLVFTFITL